MAASPLAHDQYDMARTMSPAPLSTDHLQAQFVAAEMARSHPPLEERGSRMTVTDAVVLTSLVAVDVAAWCYTALLGAQVLLG
jgi:hypothetical protein